MGTHEYYSRVRVLLTRHFLMGTRGPRVLVEALNQMHDNSLLVKLDEHPLLDPAKGLDQLCLQVWRYVRGEVCHAHRQKDHSVLSAVHEL